jgi:hypothetical protein
MTDKEVMQMALDLEKLADRFSEGWHAGIQIDASDVMLLLDSAEALRAALAQPEREWQNLTDEEMMQSYVALKSVAGFYSLEKYARDIEAKLKEKNT